jgi:hypothetical protein
MRQLGAALLLAGVIGGLAPNAWADSPPTWQTSWGGYACCGLDAADGYFYGPSAISIAPNGTVYVLDSQNDRVEYFSPDGTFLGKWGGLFNPHGITVANDSTVFVCDSNNHRIVKFSATGDSLLAWGTQGSGFGEFNFPWGISTEGYGRLFVADNGNDRVQVFNYDGQWLGQWTESGTAGGAIRCPTAIMARLGFVFVCDNCNSRVAVFNRQGGFVTAWGSFGTGPGQFKSMEGLAMDENQAVYVADTGNGRIQKFKSDGSFLAEWDSTGAGQVLAEPTGLGVPSGFPITLYVADYQDDVVHLYGYPVTGVPGEGRPGGSVTLRAAPNPAAGAVELSFTVGDDAPGGAVARAVVVDVAGRRVRELTPGLLEPGTHRIRWDGRDAAGRDAGAGVFFVKLVLDGRTVGGTRLVRVP